MITVKYLRYLLHGMPDDAIICLTDHYGDSMLISAASKGSFLRDPYSDYGEFYPYGAEIQRTPFDEKLCYSALNISVDNELLVGA